MPGQSGYAVGCGALALINAGLAQGKGRSGPFWFVISLLFDPLGTLLMVLLPTPGVEARPLGRSEWLSLVSFWRCSWSSLGSPLRVHRLNSPGVDAQRRSRRRTPRSIIDHERSVDEVFRSPVGRSIAPRR